MGGGGMAEWSEAQDMGINGGHVVLHLGGTSCAGLQKLAQQPGNASPMKSKSAFQVFN